MEKFTRQGYRAKGIEGGVKRDIQKKKTVNRRTAETSELDMQSCKICNIACCCSRNSDSDLSYGATVKIPLNARVSSVVTNATRTGKMKDFSKVSFALTQRY